MGISLDEAVLVSLFVESILYGLLIITFLACMYILVFRRNTRPFNIPMVVTAVLLFMCATMHVAIDLARVILAFYTYRAAPGGPIAFLADVRRITHVLKSTVYITETCISDALVVYRCHVIVKQYLVTFCLSLMIVGSAVAGYGSVYMLVHSPRFQGSIFNSKIAPWITSFNSITAATNILATVLIAFTIWRVNRIAARIREHYHSLSPVMLIIMESGAIYGFALLLLTAFYTRDSNAQFIVLDAVSPLIGIVFCLIIIRVATQTTSSPTTTSTQVHQQTWLWTTHPGITMEVPESTSAVTALTPTIENMPIYTGQGGLEVLEEKKEEPTEAAAHIV